MKASQRARLGHNILVIPDCQVRPGVDLSYLSWIGNYAVEKQFDSWVCVGDFGDMPSLSSYSIGKAEAEGCRYEEDIRAVRQGNKLLLDPMRKWNNGRRRKYTPVRHMCLGNHDGDRIEREVENNPKWIGKASVKDLGYEEDGWIQHPFLRVLKWQGCEWSHYFTSGPMGRACVSARAILNTRQCSAIAGHQQHFDVAVHPKTQNTAMIVGTCNLQGEKYLGEQGNDYRRQVVVLNECDGRGRFDIMTVSLSFLRAKYS